MSTRRDATVTLEAGVDRDFRGRPGPRQVTVVAREAWEEACREVGAELPWTARRANLLVEGVDLESTAGRRLRVGAVLLDITGETAPCGRMDQQRAGLRTALGPDWRGGVTCRVLEEGEIRVGDPVTLLDGDSAPRGGGP